MFPSIWRSIPLSLRLVALLALTWSRADAEQSGAAAVNTPTAGSVAARPLAAPDSPRASFHQFNAAAHDGRWQDAARFVPLPRPAPERSVELAKRLKIVLDGIYVLAPETLSAESSGSLDDGLPPDVEDIGQVTSGSDREPIRLVRLSDEKGLFWAFSPATVGRIDA